MIQGGNQGEGLEAEPVPFRRSIQRADPKP